MRRPGRGPENAAGGGRALKEALMLVTRCPPAGVAGHLMARKSARRSSAHARGAWRTGFGAAVVTLAAVLFAPAAGAQPLPLGCQKQHGVTYCPRVSYGVHTLNNTADPTFNQLLGINASGVIGGYFGSGVPVGNQGHPNQGYLLFPPYVQNYYANDNFPGSVQTQVTGLNDQGDMVGFYSTMNNANNAGNDNFGWYRLNGQYHLGDFPTTNPASPPVDQLLGISDKDVAVGFFTDGAGANHGYTFNVLTGQSQGVNVPGFTNVTATGINDLGDISGFGNSVVNGKASSSTEGFLLRGAKVFTINFSGSSSTVALGVNDNDEVVGTETFPGSATGVPGQGNTPGMHGFTWYPSTGFTIVDDRNGVQSNTTTTTINGLNRCGDLVGFYVDGNGNTDGMLANAQFTSTSSSGHASALDARTRHKG